MSGQGDPCQQSQAQLYEEAMYGLHPHIGGEGGDLLTGGVDDLAGRAVPDNSQGKTYIVICWGSLSYVAHLAYFSVNQGLEGRTGQLHVSQLDHDLLGLDLANQYGE